MAEFKPVTLEKWGGLNLRDDEAEVALDGAIDLLNVDFDRRGRIRTRDGYNDFVAVTSATHVASIHPYLRSTGAKQLLVGATTGVTETLALDTTSATVGTYTPNSAYEFANWGSPSATLAYGVKGEADLIRWSGATDGSGFLTVASGAGTATHIGVQPSDNRLVVADGNSNGRVWFSDAGDPETWDPTNFVDLTPGDGDAIQAIRAWRDVLFVFKRSKFFVFYGNSTDSTGGAVFNYRPVVAGKGALGRRAVTVAPDGVYFADRTGIYRTTGGAPELVSAEMSPLFDRTTGALFQGDDLVASDSANTSVLHWHRDRLYFSFPTTGTTPSHTLVYELRTRAWSLWDIAADAFASWDTSSSVTSAQSLFFTSGGTIYELSPSYTDDNGTAITSRYRTGFFTPAGATVPSTIREVLLEGTGTVSVKGSSDYGALGTAASIALGTSPAIVQNRAVVANYGRYHSYEFSSTVPWSLNRATFHVESKGPVGKQP